MLQTAISVTRKAMVLGNSRIVFTWILFCLPCSNGQAAENRNKRQIHFTRHPTSPQPTSSSSSSSPSADIDPLSRWLTSAKITRPNVLMLIVDDLRPKLGCYGDTNMVTPNIDQLASKSVRFDRAYAQQAVCGPSRTSFLTGRRPDTTRVVDLVTYWRTAGGNFTTLPQYFKEHGYVTQGVGKVYHPGVSGGSNDDMPYSWSAPLYHGTPEIEPETDNKTYHRSSLQPVNVSVAGKQQDTDVADFSIGFLRNHTQSSRQPFFLAVGFHKPHLPFRYPKEYEDAYVRTTAVIARIGKPIAPPNININRALYRRVIPAGCLKAYAQPQALYPFSRVHLAPHNTVPPEMPPIAWSSYGELRKFEDIIALNVSQPYGPIPDDYQLRLRRGYSAAVSYVDAEVGRVLAEVDKLGLSQDTVIVFMGDHGWQLGENGEWSKHTNFEIAVRIPLTIYIPGVSSTNHRFDFIDPLTMSSASAQTVDQLLSPGHSTDALAEAVDLFPTLSELSGLPVPSICPEVSRDVLVCTEGSSLLPVIRQVRESGHTGGHEVQWKKAAFSQFHRRLQSTEPVMGYTIRTAQHRYTEWVAFDKTNFRANFSRLYARELYVEAIDPDEYRNVAEVPSYRQTVESLSQMLRRGWRGTYLEYLAQTGQDQ